jgi:hypothetical protein
MTEVAKLHENNDKLDKKAKTGSETLSESKIAEEALKAKLFPKSPSVNPDEKAIGTPDAPVSEKSGSRLKSLRKSTEDIESQVSIMNKGVERYSTLENTTDV